MSVCRIIFIVFSGILLVLPLVQMQFKIFPPQRLVNTSIPALEQFQLRDFFSGQWQQQFERWFLRSNKLWAYMLKTDNQINLSVFSQIGSRYREEMQLGHENYLYQLLYLKDINRPVKIKRAKLDLSVRQLKFMQDQLAAQGKAFVVIISQNKLAYRPDLVPNLYRSRKFNDPKRLANIMRELFVQYDINHIDAGQLFAQHQQNGHLQFYNRSGSHWTQPGACLIAHELVQTIKVQLGKPLNGFECGSELTWKPEPNVEDRDLAGAINVWNQSPTYGLTPYVSINKLPQSDAFKPSVLIVGTSFMWSIRSILESHNFYRLNDFYFYNKTNYYFREENGKRNRGKHSINSQQPNWPSILSHDVVVLEANEALLGKLGFKFVEQFYKAFTTRRAYMTIEEVQRK